MSKLSIIDQHFALSYITFLFDTQAPTRFGIHVSSSGSFVCLCEFLKEEMFMLFVMYCECWWPVCTGCCGFVCYVVHNITHISSTI
jgi:hypothetical protein